MSSQWLDAEIMVDEKGNMRVPRVVTAPAPPKTELRGSNPVEFNEIQIWRGYPSALGPDDVEVAVSFVSLSPAFPNCTEFSGKVTAVGENIKDEGLFGERYV